MSQSTESKNKALVLEAFETLFNKRDYAAAERFWSSDYVQHSAHIEPGREGLFNLIKGAPASLKYEPGVIVADGDFVIIHGRFSGMGRPRNWIAADVVRVADGVLAEHWDVLQDEATRAELKSGLPMFGTQFREGTPTAFRSRRDAAPSISPRHASQLTKSYSRALGKTTSPLAEASAIGPGPPSRGPARPFHALPVG